MPLPNIDTFEHDIAEEIKNKEATIGDIASAGGDIGNVTTKGTPMPTLVVLLGIVFLLAVIAIGVILFIQYSNSRATTPAAQASTPLPAAGPRMGEISSTIDSEVGLSTGAIQKSEYGYIVELISYSDVFAYMLKNESMYADELAEAVGSPRDLSTTTPRFTFADMTINNQNMRVGTSGNGKVVYSFVNTKYLLISSTPEGILSLRGAILP